MQSVPFDALTGGAFVASGDGRVVATNAACREMLRDEVAGLPLAVVFPDEPEVAALLAASAGGAVRLHARRRDGVPISADALVSALDGAGTLLCQLREVREERLLSETQRWLDVAFERSPIGMALFDTDGRYARVNDALCQMLGRPAEELLGRRDQELTHPDDRQRDVDAAWKILNGEIDTFQTEKRFLAADGTTVWAIANLTFLRDEAGRPLCWLGQFQDITASKFAEQRLQHLADHDELTGVANRRRLLHDLEAHLGEGEARGGRGAVVLVDLDGFKEINDTQGHGAGDRILVSVAEALRGCLQPHDVLGRLGGDEFAAVVPYSDADHALALARRMVEAVAALLPGTLGASCGVALYGDGHGYCSESVLAAADQAMYEAKATGRNNARLARRAVLRG